MRSSNTQEKPVKKQVSNSPQKKQLSKLLRTSDIHIQAKNLTHSFLDQIKEPSDPEINISNMKALKSEDSFQKFFKFSPEKKFVKQGKTPEIKKTISQQMQKPNQETQCPFKEMKSSWLTASKKSLKTGDTLLEKIGIERFGNIIKIFLGKILKNPKIGEFFKNKNMEKVAEGLSFFFSKQLNFHTPSLESLSVSMQNIHKDIKVTNEAFDIFKGYFALTFREFEIEEEITGEFLQFLEKGRKHVVMEKGAFEKAEEIFLEKNLLTEKLINRIKSNSLLNCFFEKWDFSQHKKHMGHLYDCLGKDHMVSDLYLRKCHKDLGISSEVLYHYKQVINLSLRELKVNDGLIFDILTIFEDSRLPLLNEKPYFDLLLEKNDFYAIIKRFVMNINNNKILFELFKGYNPDKLLAHCRIMLEFCLKGPSSYSECDITPAHLNLKLSHQHYLAMREVFEKALMESKLNQQDIVYILADLDYFKFDICNEKCLFERIGGEKNIEYIVNSFYIKAFQNPKLCSFFKNSDPILMIKNQKFFFSKFFQPKTIKSCHFKDLRTFHLNMELNDDHFSFFVQTMVEILKELNVENPSLEKEIVDWLGRTKNDVLNKSLENT